MEPAVQHQLQSLVNLAGRIEQCDILRIEVVAFFNKFRVLLQIFQAFLRRNADLLVKLVQFHEYAGACPEGKDLPIEESIDLMINNLDKKYSLRQLAQHANLSVTQYSLLFKEKTGFSPVDYFIRLKIQRACQYLDLTDWKVKEIAKKLGFSDLYYFSRSFYEIMHYSPKNYRDIKKG